MAVATGTAILGAGLLGAGSAALSARNSNKTALEQQRIANAGDPRINAILHGQQGQPGLLGHYQNMLSTPQNAQLQNFGQSQLNYLSTAPDNLASIQNAGNGLINGQSAPQAQAAGIGDAAWAKGNMVNAPAQNNMNLSGSYDSFINGDRGGNTRLTSAIQGGINQSKNMFDQMQRQATDHLQKNVLSGIRSNSVLSGQYGGSRQGIAEGNAIGDFAEAQQQAINQFGQNNTNAAVGAQAQAYETDSNRALAATQGLGAQQYGVAQQDAATKNAAEFMNVGQFNQNIANNAQMQQQTNLANLNAQQGQNQLNQAGKIAGAGLLSGQMGQAYQYGTANQDYALNRAQQVNGLLSPYLSSNPPQQIAPQSSVGGSALGGAMAGLGLYNQFNQASRPPAGGDVGYFGQQSFLNGVG
ncbi:MAG TPA: hypothetical protein VGE56_00740 [Rhodocyclaceae bacterium]